MSDISSARTTSSSGGVNWPAIGDLGAKIAQLPNDYWKSLEQNYNQQNREVFANGVPTDAQGNPDFKAAYQRLLQVGGTAGIKPASDLVDFGIKLQTQDNDARARGFLGNPQDNPSGTGPANSTTAMGLPRVDSRTGGGTTPYPPSPQNNPAQPQQTGIAGDNGRNTWMTYITSKVGPENAGRVAALIKGTDPNAPMPPGYEAAADRAIAAWQTKSGAQPQTAPGFSDAAQHNPSAPAASLETPQSVQASPQTYFKPNGQPVTAGEAYQNSGGNTQAQPQPFGGRGTLDQIPGTPANSNSGNTDPTLGGLIPRGWSAPAYLSALQQRAATQALSPNVAKVYQEKIQAIQKALASNSELTPDMKDAQAAGMPLIQYQATKAETESRAKHSGELYAKRYDAITEAGSRAIQEIPKLQYAEKLMDDPNFYSGVGEKYSTTLKGIAVALGADPNLAAPNQAFTKIIRDSITQGLSQFRGLGQVRVAEINLITQATASEGNTPAANKIILKVAQRVNERNAAVASMAQSYNNGNLDAGFDRLVSQYDARNPVFTPEEISNWKKILTADDAAKPRTSDGIPRVSSPEEAAKLPSRTRFLDANGIQRVRP